MKRTIFTLLFFVAIGVQHNMLQAQCSNFTLNAVTTLGTCDTNTNMVSVAIDFTADFSSGNASWQWSYTINNADGTSSTVVGPLANTNSSDAASIPFMIPCDSSVTPAIQAWSAPNGGGNNCGVTFFGTSTLPVEWGAIVVENDGQNNHLFWKTEVEINNEYFEIQYSGDGETFRTIGKVEGAGTSSESVDYEFVHREVYSGLNYYRIKQVDYEGYFAYSDIVVERRILENLELSIYPNPTSELLNIKGFKDQDLEWKIFSMEGRLELSGSTAKIAISNLRDGNHVIVISKYGTPIQSTIFTKLN